MDSFPYSTIQCNTDTPYHPSVWREVFQVMKPGGYFMAFVDAETREDISRGYGFEIVPLETEANDA